MIDRWYFVFHLLLYNTCISSILQSNYLLHILLYTNDCRHTHTHTHTTTILLIGIVRLLRPGLSHWWQQPWRIYLAQCHAEYPTKLKFSFRKSHSIRRSAWQQFVLELERIWRWGTVLSSNRCGEKWEWLMKAAPEVTVADAFRTSNSSMRVVVYSDESAHSTAEPGCLSNVQSAELLQAII